MTRRKWAFRCAALILFAVGSVLCSPTATQRPYVLLTGKHGDWVYSVASSPDRAIVASGSCDKTIKLWSTSDASLARTLQGHAGPVFSISFSPDGSTIASASANNTIKLWRVSDGSLTRTYHVETVPWSVSFSLDGRLAAYATDRLFVWDPSKLALGDLDLDGRVMLGDVLMALGCALGLVPVTPERLESGDVNHNGRIDVADVVLILRAAVGLIVL